MIVCPNCNKENADASAHCGFCGQQLSEGGKKTMFGMAALSADQIRAAADAAKQKAAEQAPSLNLPKPGQGSGLPTPSQLNQQDDAAFAKTEMMPSVSTTAATDAKPDPFAADFAALEAQFGQDSDFNDEPVDPSPSMGTERTTVPTPMVQAQQVAATPTPSPQPAANPAPMANQNAFGNAGPSQFGAGPGAGNAMQQAPKQSLQAPKKDNKKLLIIGAVVLGLMFVLCAIGTVVALFFTGAAG